MSTAGEAYCRRTWAYTYDAHGNQIGSAGSAASATACGNTKSYSFTVPANAAPAPGRTALDPPGSPWRGISEP